MNRKNIFQSVVKKGIKEDNIDQAEQKLKDKISFDQIEPQAQTALVNLTQNFISANFKIF